MLDIHKKDTLISQKFIIENIIIENFKMMSSMIDDPHENAFEEVEINGKSMTWIDLCAERDTQRRLYTEFDRSNLKVIGEETIMREGDTDISDLKRNVVVLDMIDGTDLLEKSLGNWCSAIVILDPTEPKIIGSFVALSDCVYYTTENTNGVYKCSIENRFDPNNSVNIIVDETVSIDGVNQGISLRDASICTYGQKGSSLAGIFERCDCSDRIQWLRDEARNLRFYDLAGNPMMAKVADRDLDLVFEVNGQQPHDVAPGAHIAIEAGASLINIETGEEVSSGELAALTSRPSERLTYVLAASKSLGEEFCDVFV